MQRQNLTRQTIDRMSMTAKRLNITILEVVGVVRETSETPHCRGLIQLAQLARDPPALPELEGRTFRQHQVWSVTTPSESVSISCVSN